MYDLSDKLAKRGWHLSALQKPPALHLAVTKLTKSALPALEQTLLEVVKELSAEPDQKPSGSGTNALYGVAGSVKTSGAADRLLVGFLDTLYKTQHDF